MAIKVNKFTTLTATLAASATTGTLTSAAFDNGTQVPLVLEYDNTAKIEVILADITGTALTNIVRAQDGTSDVEHTGTPKIGQGSTPSTWEYWYNKDHAFTGARAYLTNRLATTVSGTPTKVALDAETYDVGADFASNKYVAPVNGYYLVSGMVTYTALTTGKYYASQLWVDGAVKLKKYDNFVTASSNVISSHFSDVIYLDKDSYVELYYEQDGGTTTDIMEGADSTFLAVTLFKEV